MYRGVYFSHYPHRQSADTPRVFKVWWERPNEVSDCGRLYFEAERENVPKRWRGYSGDFMRCVTETRFSAAVKRMVDRNWDSEDDDV